MDLNNATKTTYYRHSSHATYNLTGHIVWITKYRRKVLNKKMTDRIKTIIE